MILQGQQNLWLVMLRPILAPIFCAADVPTIQKHMVTWTLQCNKIYGYDVKINYSKTFFCWRHIPITQKHMVTGIPKCLWTFPASNEQEQTYILVTHHFLVNIYYKTFSFFFLSGILLGCALHVLSNQGK